MIVGLAGYARSGKDTLGGFLVRGHGFRRIAFADPLKKLALLANPVLQSDFAVLRFREAVEYYGWDRAKAQFPELRIFLQHLGVGARSVFGDDVWVRAALDRVSPGERVVVTDCRFPNEVDAIRSKGGVVVRVNRPGFGPANDHVSEVGLDAYQFQFVVNNDRGVADLAAVAGDLVEDLAHMGYFNEEVERAA